MKLNTKLDGSDLADELFYLAIQTGHSMETAKTSLPPTWAMCMQNFVEMDKILSKLLAVKVFYKMADAVCSYHALRSF